MAQPKKKTSVRLEDVCFYFDSVERDRLDASGTSRKSGEVLALRERLLKLPDENFDAAIKTLKSLVDDATPSKDADSRATRGQRGRQLYDQVRPGTRASGGAPTKVSPT